MWINSEVFYNITHCIIKYFLYVIAGCNYIPVLCVGMGWRGNMKAIVEQYAKGIFAIDRPLVRVSEDHIQKSIEAGTLYAGSFMVESENDYPIKGMVYDSRYILRFETHNFISRRFEVKYTLDATCLEEGQTFSGHISVITDGGEFSIPYDIDIVSPCIRYNGSRIDDLFKFATLAERNWSEAAKLFVDESFRRTFIDKDPLTKQVYTSLLESRSINQSMEEFLVMVHKKRTVTLSVDKPRFELEMPAETEAITVEISKNTWGHTFSEIKSDCEFIISSKKCITEQDFNGNICELKVYISPEHVPDGENSGRLTIQNIYQTIHVDIHLSRPKAIRPNTEQRARKQEYKRNRINILQAYLDFRMDRIGLDEYISDTIEALRNLNELDSEEDLYRLGIMHMNILSGDLAKVEQEFLRIEADIDKNLMSNQQKCYYSYLKALMLKDEEAIEKAATLIRRTFRTDEPKIFYFWLLLFVDTVYNEDKNALYNELEKMYYDGENSPIIYFEQCDLFNANPMMLKKLGDFEITTVKWGIRHKYISDDVLNEFVKIAGKNKDFNKQIFDILRQIYDKNILELSKYSDDPEYGTQDKETRDDDFKERFTENFGSDFDADDELYDEDEDIDYLLDEDEDEEENAESEDEASLSFQKKERTEKIVKKENENDEVLRSICSMLISANMLDTRYHRFYKAAVLKSFKFIGLNECYIRSMNRSSYELIPTSVLMYLNYKNTLNDEELAYLYANVIYNKAENMKIYHEYSPSMEDFMENMIIKGEVNDDLTVIYDEFLEPESVSSMFAGKLINIIFKRKLVCFNKNVRAVIINHEELSGEQRVPLVNGEAYVEIISDNASVIFEDNMGNRYAGSIPYRFERIVDEKAYMQICREYSPKDYRVILFDYQSIKEFTYKNAKEVNAAREVINCDKISYDYKQKACLNIIEYYHENLDRDVLIRYLDRLDIEYMTHANTRTIISYLIDMNMFDKAFQAVKLYGFNELDVDELYRLADYGVKDSEGFLNEDLMSICLNIYKTGTVNSNILTYIIMNFHGGLMELAELFKLAKDRVSDVSLLAENTLAQMMFTKGFIEYIYDIFATYYNGRSRGLVVKAFLRLCAYNYLIKDAQVPSNILECLYLEVEKGDIDDEISKMALMLYFSHLDRYSNQQKNWISENVSRFIDAGKILPFFKSFASFIRLPQDVFLKTYLIYKTENRRGVFVDYSFDAGTRAKAVTKRKRLEEVVTGLYVLEFVLFHGERLVYSIVDDENGNVKIVESDVLKTKSWNKKEKNRFEMINSMLVDQEMRKDNKLLQDLDVYINTVHLFEENLDIL